MKKLKVFVTSLMVIIMALSVSACNMSASSEQDAADQAYSEETFNGILQDAFGDAIVVSNDADVKEFNTTAETEYIYDGEKSISLGDELQVGYHVEGTDFIADQVVVKKHEADQTLILKGDVSDLDDTVITVHSGSLTVSFAYDSRTKIDGKLTEKDEVEVTYMGDISESPYAVGIKVLQDRTDESIHTVTGTVSEINKDSLLISMDSAGAHRFKLNLDELTNTEKVNIALGDRVTIAYTGDLDDKPTIRRITIQQKAKDETVHVIDGTIKKVSGATIILTTGKKTYTVVMNGDTAVKGRSFITKGTKATITYKGDVKDGKLVAISIYCYKKKDPKKPTEPTKPTNPTDPTDPTQTEPTGPTQTEPTETEPTEPTEPEQVYVDATGVIVSWGQTCKIKVDSGSELTLDAEHATVASGYFPEAGDKVKIKYEKNSMILTDLQLIDRPQPEPATEDDGGDGGSEDSSSSDESGE
ncbi:MAG: hypothetical protein Q4A65_05715 [Bacillota bacterium]|nr:hypothetical protein [Bacillota bacterium]